MCNHSINFYESNKYLNIQTILYFRKIEDKMSEHNILDFTQITSNSSLQTIRTEMDDSVSRQTEDILNMMQLLDLE